MTFRHSCELYVILFQQVFLLLWVRDTKNATTVYNLYLTSLLPKPKILRLNVYTANAHCATPFPVWYKTKMMQCVSIFALHNCRVSDLIRNWDSQMSNSYLRSRVYPDTASNQSIHFRGTGVAVLGWGAKSTEICQI